MMEITGNTIEERIMSQLDAWIAGESLHNHVEGVCCPDGSCCDKSIRTQPDIKRLFKINLEAGRQDVVQAMLLKFLINEIQRTVGGWIKEDKEKTRTKGEVFKMDMSKISMN